MNEVEEYILKLSQHKKEIALYFHSMFIEDYGLRPKISFRIPMYYGKKWVVYLNPDNRAGVELAFTRGHLLSNKQGLLESKGRKMVSSIEFLNLEEIPEKAIREIIEEAIELDNLK